MSAPATMSTFDAAMIADGCWELTSFEESEENYVRAFQQLIDDGSAWSLQGRVGREAAALIQAGLCEGEIP